jgi:hypothetical protein
MHSLSGEFACPNVASSLSEAGSGGFQSLAIEIGGLPGSRKPSLFPRSCCCRGCWSGGRELFSELAVGECFDAKTGFAAFVLFANSGQ